MGGTGFPERDLKAEGATGRLGSRLDSWKEIASYLGRSEKTVRRWEKAEELPIQRLRHKKRGSVYAYTSELDAWREARKLDVESEGSTGESRSKNLEAPSPPIKGKRPVRLGPSVSDPVPPPVAHVVKAPDIALSNGQLSANSDQSEAGDPTSLREHQSDSNSATTNRFGLPFQRQFLALAGLSALSLVAGIAWFTSHRTSVQGDLQTGERIQSLAVLPLENLTGDNAHEYFADGMTAELITQLAKIASLRVISRTSAMRYKRSGKSLDQIARELSVEAVLEGEVLRTERRVRITAQLIHAATDRHLWAETYERDLRDAVELQGEVAESIAAAIRTKVTPEEHARLARNHRVNPEAYEAYLKGRFFWNKRTESGLKKSIECFQDSIQKDPGYALPYLGLADSYNVSAYFGFLPRKDAYSKARAAANNALKLDDTLGQAHTVLGDLMFEMDWDWRGAEREFKRAIELTPGEATTHQRYSLFLMVMKRTEESLTEIRRAQALDPLSLPINSSVGWRLLWARRYDEAIKQLQKTLEMDPNFGRTHMYLGWAYEARGESKKAIDELRKATLSAAGSEEMASLGHAYAAGGYRRQARNVLKELEERSHRGYASQYNMAVVYAGLGDKDRAFEWLAKSCRDRDVGLAALNTDLELDNLRSDPRFQDLLRCAGLLS